MGAIATGSSVSGIATGVGPRVVPKEVSKAVALQDTYVKMTPGSDTTSWVFKFVYFGHNGALGAACKMRGIVYTDAAIMCPYKVPGSAGDGGESVPVVVSPFGVKVLLAGLVTLQTQKQELGVPVTMVLPDGISAMTTVGTVLGMLAGTFIGR